MRLWSVLAHDVHTRNRADSASTITHRTAYTTGSSIMCLGARGGQLLEGGNVAEVSVVWGIGVLWWEVISVCTRGCTSSCALWGFTCTIIAYLFCTQLQHHVGTVATHHGEHAAWLQTQLGGTLLCISVLFVGTWQARHRPWRPMHRGHGKFCRPAVHVCPNPPVPQLLHSRHPPHPPQPSARCHWRQRLCRTTAQKQCCHGMRVLQ